MKDSLWIATVVILLIIPLIFFWNRRKNSPDRSESARATYSVPAEAYVGLRDQIFQGVREHMQLPSDFPPTEPWAVVMDWGVQDAVVTIVAVQDGSASMYYSTGGGNIGGGKAHESIRTAAKNALSIASRHTKQLKSVTKWPLPARQGQVFFYVLTDSGIYFAEASQGELSSNRHELSDLGTAMQTIVTEYRLNQK